MSRDELRLECLRLAVERHKPLGDGHWAGGVPEIVAEATGFYEFVIGSDTARAAPPSADACQQSKPDAQAPVAAPSDDLRRFCLSLAMERTRPSYADPSGRTFVEEAQMFRDFLAGANDGDGSAFARHLACEAQKRQRRADLNFGTTDGH